MAERAGYEWVGEGDDAYLAPAEPPTERDGLAVGDRVLVNRQPCEVMRFTSLACDVVVRYLPGSKRSLTVAMNDGLGTVCRRQAEVVKA